MTFFILDLNDFLALIFFDKIDFSLNNKLRAFFSLFFLCSFISQKHVAYSQEKYGISHFQLF